MVIVTLMFSSAIVLMTFVVMYSLFFPWWQSILGRALIVSKLSTATLLILGISYFLNWTIPPILETIVLVTALCGLVSSNGAIIHQLVTTWGRTGEKNK